MKSKIRIKIISILLALTVMIPVPAFGIEGSAEAGPEPETAAVEQVEVLNEEKGETSVETIQEESAEEDASEKTEEEPAAIGFLENITIEENPTGTADIHWTGFDGAAYYKVSSPQINYGEAVVTETCEEQFSGLAPATTYDFVITAFDESDQEIAQGAISIGTVAYSINFSDSWYRSLGSKVLKPKKKLKIELRSMIKESNKGYSVVQGGCTDGKYAYYLMVSTKTQKGRVLKVKLKNNKVVKRSKVLKIWHGNGMAYDSKRKKLVVIAREHRKQEITWIDAKKLKITRQENVKYDYYPGAGSDSLWTVHQRQGLAAIAYVPRYDCYVALERVYHNLLFFDPDSFQAIGMAFTEIPANYPGTFQAMDADDKYVYLVLSSYQQNKNAQPYNLIIALDWNSENLLPVVNASKSKDLPYVQKAWYCNNDGSGAPDAVIRVTTKHEAENIYHTTDKYGREHFYLSEYYCKPVYKKVTKKVKVNGKWKKKKVKKLKYYKRKNRVYDLGII